jgi:hypothetical protein
VATPTLNGHFRTPVVGRSSELVSARVTVSDSPGNGHEIWTGGFGTAATARAGAAVKCVAREHAPTAHCGAARVCWEEPAARWGIDLADPGERPVR